MKPDTKWRFAIDFVPHSRLTETSVDDALEALCTMKGNLHVGEPLPETISIGFDNDSEDVAVAPIEKQGEFTQEQIEAMKTLWVWQQVCSEGYQCSSWVSSVVAPVVDEKGDAGSVIEEFLTSWPLFFYQALDLTYNLQNCFDADVEPCSTKEQYEPSLCTVKVGLSET
ncbi:hypothetical protein PC116_g12911 [Phytophthora cactorum]|uniref:Uncharacterized protein n=1 Tax=Phytophthora cactorum TaxID=29920 RepID=A0A8T0ZEN3_9STRA|nr:hypothetical protein PC111_g8314 [Phytophthora cactorum]KAG2860263.1 hypothetical protein PC113_g8223 [Phytophthora cactorum]KAG2908763.1 hypothetical protein PC114_g10333 [Phytophthora cactorum]KAG2940528.1 hypothetical protein PC115_g2541 [Phytophthora cactorum]KAG2941534.1 hypothetical protein PC117_g10193 [Phytophthora cactorum]